MIRRFQKYTIASAATFVALVILGATTLSQTQAPRPAPSQTASQPAPQADPNIWPDAESIAAPLIVDEAMKLKQRLRGMPDRLPPETLFVALDQEINDLRKAITDKSAEADAMIQARATVGELQQSALDWQSLSKQDTDLAERLARLATTIEGERRILSTDQTRWNQTYDRIRSDNSAADLVDIAKVALSDLKASITLTDKQRDRIIALQKAVAAQGSIISGEVENIRKAMAELQRSLFEQDSQPLWRIQFQAQTDEAVIRLLRKSYESDLARLRSFISAKRRAIVWIVLLTITALVICIRLRRRISIASVETSEPEVQHPRLPRPGSLALLIGLVVTKPLLVEAPLGARAIVDLLFVVPIVRLLMPRITRPYRRMIIALICSVLAWELIKFLDVRLWIKRDLLAVFCVAVAVLFCWMLPRIPPDSVRNRNHTLIAYAVYTGAFLIVVSLFANVFGYIGLSDLIGNGALMSANRAVAFYTIFVVGIAIIFFTLRTTTARRLSFIRTGTDRIGRRVSSALGLILLFAWLSTTLNLFAIKDDVYRILSAGFNYQITVGTVSFAPGNIIVFLMTLFLGYVVASITRAILGDDVLPRLNLARGVPNAIATFAHYLLLLLVFLFALAAAGVELSKFTILTGALGVGVGFGLQNVVNNFSSGLILLLERPVRVGDVLEVGPISGQVTNIGFRSSTLRSPDGAALIIPNGSLISQQVTNWTLSGTLRRVFLRFRVAYGNDPERVRDLLLNTTASHPDVLTDPAPSVLFLGFGESALEFEVWFWAPGSDIVPTLKSEVSLKVATALRDAGINVPFPQRELHVKSIEAAREALMGPEKNTEAATESRALTNSHP